MKLAGQVCTFSPNWLVFWTHLLFPGIGLIYDQVGQSWQVSAARAQNPQVLSPPSECYDQGLSGSVCVLISFVQQHKG